VYVGFSAEKSVKELTRSKAKTVSDRVIMEFRMECRSFIQTVLSKLKLKSPLKYEFAKKLSCLDPKTMATESCEANIAAFRVLVRHLNEASRVAEGDADSVIAQYKKFVEEVCPQHKSQFLGSSNRVDQLYHGLLAGSDAYGQLWSVVKMLLLLSHVERGFSVNRQVDGDNLHADTFCCRRLICDTVAYFGGIYAIDTTNKELLLSCSSAWLKYQLDLEQNKKTAMKDTMTRKRKAVDDEIQNLKSRKLELSTDIESLTASADSVSRKGRKFS